MHSFFFFILRWIIAGRITGTTISINLMDHSGQLILLQGSPVPKHQKSRDPPLFSITLFLHYTLLPASFMFIAGTWKIPDLEKATADPEVNSGLAQVAGEGNKPEMCLHLWWHLRVTNGGRQAVCCVCRHTILFWFHLLGLIC